MENQGLQANPVLTTDTTSTKLYDIHFIDTMYETTFNIVYVVQLSLCLSMKFGLDRKKPPEELFQ